MDVLSALVSLAYGFKDFGGRGYPCHWCGEVTTLLDAEDFHVCKKHQLEYIEIGYDAMQAKYPLAGEDARNPTFFEKRDEHYITRGRRLTLDELRLLVQRACHYEKIAAQEILDGKALEEFDERQIWSLGHAAEQYIDDWQ